MFILVALGSALGGVARFAIGSFIEARFGGAFPVGTLLVNVSGAVLLGFILTCTLASPNLSPEMRGLLTTGFCGGYTTFSTFTLETMLLLERGELARAAAYVVLSIVIALLGVWLGVSLGRGLVVARQVG